MPLRASQTEVGVSRPLVAQGADARTPRDPRFDEANGEDAKARIHRFHPWRQVQAESCSSRLSRSVCARYVPVGGFRCLSAANYLADQSTLTQFAAYQVLLGHLSVSSQR